MMSYCDFLFFFKDGSRSSYWICLGHICTIHVVSITL